MSIEPMGNDRTSLNQGSGEVMSAVSLVIALGYLVVVFLGGLFGYVIGFNRGIGWQHELRRKSYRRDSQ